ncbi:MAG: hypothetical protein JXL80_15810 [Planctomycetes bacterium]|nr:hypothetical protein [Planctomycetota bacterium]
MPRLTREELRLELQKIAHRTITLALTTNASSYISFRPDREPLDVRIQRAFLDAPDDVIVGVGRWLGGRSRRCPEVVDRFINCPPPELVEHVHTRRRDLKTEGRCYHLGALLDRVNRRFFRNTISTRITWGRRLPRRRVQARTLGIYYRGENVIVLSPVLDQWLVPEWFVEFTVYHECLHVLQHPGERPHGPAFRRRLRLHPHYGAAMQWEKANIDLLTGHQRQVQQQAACRVERKDNVRQLDFDW